MSIAIVSCIAGASRDAAASPSTNPGFMPGIAASPACLASTPASSAAASAAVCDASACRRNEHERTMTACRDQRITAAFRETADASETTAAIRSATCRAARSGPACACGVAIDSAVMTSRNLLSSACPTVLLPFVTAPSRSHCLEIGRHGPRDVRGVGAERRRLREARRVDLDVVARATVGRDRDAERRLREHEARLSLARSAPSAC